MRLILVGIAIAAVVYVATSGHVLFLPLVLFLPIGLFGFKRRRER